MIDASPQWTIKHRDICWSVLATARTKLQIQLHTAIANAFALLQWYYSSCQVSPYELYISTITALLAGCKAVDEFRELKLIFCAVRDSIKTLMCRCCRKCPIELFGHININADDLTDSETDQIFKLETDLYSAVGWEIPVDQPFDILQSVLSQELKVVNCPKEREMISNSAITACCLLMKCGEYTKIPPAAAAAASIGVADRKYRLPPGLKRWMENTRNGDPESFELAVAVLSRDMCRCVSCVKRFVS